MTIAASGECGKGVSMGVASAQLPIASTGASSGEVGDMGRQRATTDRVGWASAGQPRLVALLRVTALVPVLVVTFAVAAARSEDVVGPPLLVGTLLIAIGTLVTLGSGYRQFTHPAMIVIPVLDLVALLVFQLVPGGEVAGALVAVPALWLGGIYRWRGVAIVGMTAAVGVLAEEVLAGPDLDSVLARTASIGIVAVVASAAMAAVVGLWLAQVAALESQGAALAAALDDVRKHQSFVDAIVRSVDVGLAYLGPDGSYESLNPRHAELMALSFPHGHGGRAGEVGSIFAADNATRVVTDQLPSVRAMRGEHFSDTLWIGDLAATRHAISVSGRPILDEHGDFAGAVVAYHDITTLMRSLAVKDQFVASVSHELRTPLSSIIGYLELALSADNKLPAQVVRHLGVASRNADRMLHLVSDLLTAANPDDAALQLFPERVDFSELVRLGVDDAARGAELADVRLTSKIAPGLCLVGDRSRLMQVTENLLSNAIKYTHPGGEVEIVVSRIGPRVVLTVQDTGIGVSDADQHLLFTRFFRASNAHELVIPGVGLGLAISKEIVEAHDGSIELESSEGVGTTVRVTLAAQAGDETHAPALVAPAVRD
jgi:two-component system, OmpR family, phosphate regulon sensor histidine kinase PhoR